eukprot:TRINITY_DN5993_c0_g1_i1.p1 TRINITY_DN5993_c0_g1~~TRINITY_DN5993_c0_g1_i1.p1  ORF type:complete len:232 (+),score=21.27 TRINITY_DN5993_c0_g1_i1:274-969(+)
MRMVGPVKDSVCNFLQDRLLTPHTCILNLEWQSAPVLVTLNSERRAINITQAQRHAVASQDRVLYWRVQICVLSHLPQGYIETLFEKHDDQLHQYFVKGGPCVLTTNIHVKANLVNGTVCRFHSIAYGNTSISQSVANKISESQPGSFVSIPPPLHVIVSVMLPSGSERLIPIACSSSDSIKLPLYVNEPNGDSRRLRARMQMDYIIPWTSYLQLLISRHRVRPYHALCSI